MYKIYDKIFSPQYLQLFSRFIKGVSMFKNLFTSLLVAGLFLTANATIEAKTNKIASEMVIYSPVLVSPLNYDVKTGDLINLKLNNRSNQDIVFRVPLMDIDVEISKYSNKVVPINFSKPPEKAITFFVKLAPGNTKTGTFKVSDYKVKEYSSNVEAIDTTVLKDIINYKKSDSEWEAKYSMSPKEEPVAILVEEEESVEVEETPEPVSPQKEKSGGFVRGFW